MRNVFAMPIHSRGGPWLECALSQKVVRRTPVDRPPASKDRFEKTSGVADALNVVTVTRTRELVSC